MRIILMLLWVGISWPGLTQQVFNRVFILEHPANYLENMIVHNDTIVGYGITFETVPPYRQCLFVARFDSNGVFIDRRLICDSLGGAYTMAINWSKIVATSDGGYALTASAFDRHDGLFIKLRNDLSVEFVQEYLDTINFVEFYNAVIELQDGYLLGGYVQTPNYLIEPFLRRVDKQGNTAWFSYYGEYDLRDVFTCNYRINDTLIVFAGSHRPPPGTEAEHSPWVVLINLDGEIVKEWRPHPSEVPIGGILNILPIGSDSWFIRGINVVGTGPSFKYEPYFAVLDTNFQIKTWRPYDVPRSYLSYLWDIEPTPDGNFIAAGQVNAIDPNNEPAQVYGWLYKVSPGLDSLWSQRMIPPQAGTQGGYLGGVGVLSSGNMVAGGYAPLGNNVYGWLVKFSPDGCVDTILCNTVPVWEAEEMELREPPARVYPNPTSGRFFVELPEGSGPVRVQVHAPDGRVVLEQMLAGSQWLDMAGAAPGLYLCRITDTERVRFVTKLVLER